ncbi:GRAM domain-containing protein [Pyrenophora tritici-repentis]|nr:GRAM domain-containing protein [Pyrenophora tritici-repentis]KAI0626451.1 GRAM domain-containing protein [Pyrenophora tritici-repentis]
MAEQDESIGSQRDFRDSNTLAAPSANGKGPNSSTVSIASSDGGDDMNRDGAMDFLKSRKNSDARSDASSSHRRRMSKLFKGRKKRRASGSQDDLSHPDAADSVPPVPELKRPSVGQMYQSDDSLGLAKSVASSLLTEDSDAESPPPLKRPGISPHQSHAGLLTLSSPLIASETLESTDADHVALVDPLASTEDLPVRRANTPDAPTNKRGVSPVGKLKEAFAPSRRSTTPIAPKGNDGEITRPSTSGGLGSLFGGKRRETKGVDEPLQASPPRIQIGDDTQGSPLLRATQPKRINTQFNTQLNTANLNPSDAPTTFITPPTPIDGSDPSPTESTASTNSVKHTPTNSNPNVVVSPSGNMISHRRVRSATNPPSKLSQSSIPPLTPHIEEAKTPGGTAVAAQSSPGPGGFFASIFSAAQNAANNLSDTIAINGNNKNKPSQQPQKEEIEADGGEEVIGPVNADTTATDTETRRPAIETLGSGNLSLAQLGLAESNEVVPMDSAANIAMKADEASAKVEHNAAAQAVSAAYAGEKPPSIAGERPRSLTAVSAQSAPGAGSPPRQPEITDSPASIGRQGSIRSRISGGRARRHRGSSAATGNTLSNVISASTSTLAPSTALNSARLNGTGFAVAPPKRNKDFHNLFKSVPEDDYLIEDYSAALQKEILLHGRLYVSEGHLCFSSNILGWVTNLVISFDEVVSVEKKSTAVLFPNAIVIQTLHARNVFASFLSRDSTYDLIIGIWKISHPNLKSSLNGVTLDGAGGTGDKTEKAESVGSDDGSLQDSDDEVYDEDAEDDDEAGSFTEAGEGSMAGSEAGSVAVETTRKVSGAVAQAIGGGDTIEAAKAATNGAASVAQDFPGGTAHGPTECGDNDQHYDKLLIDTTIPAPLGKVYSLMFGPASGVFMRKFLVDDQKSQDLQMEDDKKGLGEDNKAYSYSYIKPLNAPVGPRQTKCNINMNLEQYDLEKAISVQCSTATPDVPNGSIFLTKTRYCLMWGPGNSTRLIMTFTVEWSGKSWLKGPIEKGANDGQMSYATSLTAALRTAVSAARPTAKMPGKGGKGKKRSKNNLLEEANTPIAAPTPASQAKGSDWGPLEPLHSLLGPIGDIVGSLITPQIIIFCLGALLMYTWFFRGTTTVSGPNHWSTAQRHVAYDELWRHEESELWSWLEERVALARVHSSVAAARQSETSTSQQASIAPENMKEREMDEAIRITEERLQALKEAVNRKRGSQQSRTRSLKEEQTWGL